MAIKIWKTIDVTEANKNEPKTYIVSTLDKREIKVQYYVNLNKFVFENSINDEDKSIIENHFIKNIFKVLNS